MAIDSKNSILVLTKPAEQSWVYTCLCACVQTLSSVPWYQWNWETNRRVSGITETLDLLETRLLTGDSCGFILRKCGGGLG